jgi:hypothetical protein
MHKRAFSSGNDIVGAAPIGIPFDYNIRIESPRDAALLSDESGYLRLHQFGKSADERGSIIEAGH